MKIKTLFTIITVAIVGILVACKQKPYEKAISYIEKLSSEVMASTNESEYDAVYNKIVALNSNEVMTNLSGLSQKQSETIQQKTIALTLDALAVKAILYVMPTNIKPSPEDISKMATDCIEKNLNTTTPPYTDVRTLVNDYYHIAR